MEIFVFAVLLGLIPAFIARSKGHGFVSWWIFGALLWIIALPCALLLKPDHSNAVHHGRERKCPACAEYVLGEAILCRYCGTRFDDFKAPEIQQPQASSSPPTTTAPEMFGACKYCGGDGAEVCGLGGTAYHKSCHTEYHRSEAAIANKTDR